METWYRYRLVRIPLPSIEEADTELDTALETLVEEVDTADPVAGEVAVGLAEVSAIAANEQMVICLIRRAFRKAEN